MLSLIKVPLYNNLLCGIFYRIVIILALHFNVILFNKNPPRHIQAHVNSFKAAVIYGLLSCFQDFFFSLEKNKKRTH